MGLAPSKYPPKKIRKHRFSFEKVVVWDVQVRRFFVVVGVNGVAMDRHGLILRENEAMGARKVFRYLRGLRDIIRNSKKVARIQKSKNPVFYRIF